MAQCFIVLLALIGISSTLKATGLGEVKGFAAAGFFICICISFLAGGAVALMSLPVH